MQTVNSWSVPAITLNLAFIDELLWPLLKKEDVLSPFKADIALSKCINIAFNGCKEFRGIHLFVYVNYRSLLKQR